MKTRTLVLISACVLSVIALFAIIGTGLFSAAAAPSGSIPAGIVGGLLLLMALAAPQIDDVANQEPESRSAIYGTFIAAIAIILVVAILYAIF